MAVLSLLSGVLYAVWFTVCILLAIWVHRDAKANGQSGLLWAIIVVLLGPLGIVVYFYLKPKASTSPPDP